MTNPTGTTGPIDPAGAAADRHVAIGVMLVLASAVAWSTSGFFARTVPIDIWTVLFWRGMFGGLSIAILAMIERKRFAFEWRRALTPAGLALQ